MTSAASARGHFATVLEQLAATDSSLSDVLASLAAVIAEEACQNGEFRARLNKVLTNELGQPADVAPPEGRASKNPSATAKLKKGRRAPGPWDPYDVYAEVGEAGLRERLSRLELEQLRDIIAEHGMNTDGLAMRWKKPDRAVDRIVERVVDRAAKGDAFRSA